MFKKLTSGLIIALGMILMPVINIALDPALEIKAFEEFEGLTLADTVEWSELNNHSLREVFEDTSLFDSLQLVTNGDFDSDLGGWYNIALNSSPINSSFDNGTALIENSDGVEALIAQQINVPTSSKIYVSGNIKKNSGADALFYILPKDVVSGSISSIMTTTQFNAFSTGVINFSSGIFTTTNDGFKIVIGRAAISTFSLNVDNIKSFNISTLIANKQYSPLFSTTFDLMSDANIKSTMDLFVSKPYLFIDYEYYGIDTLTVEQMNYWYEKYIEYKEIKAILTPPLDVEGCDVAAGCYSYFELGRVMFYDGLLSMVPREVNDRISFPIFSNLLSFAKNGAVYLINPLLSFLSDFVPFIKVDNSDVVYTDVYHDETWVYNKGSYYETDNHSFYYYNEVLSTKKIWWYWNATESKYIGYDNVDKIYRYYYHTVTFLGSGYWTQSKLAISSEEMRKYNVTYGWKE